LYPLPIPHPQKQSVKTETAVARRKQPDAYSQLVIAMIAGTACLCLIILVGGSVWIASQTHSADPIGKVSLSGAGGLAALGFILWQILAAAMKVHKK